MKKLTLFVLVMCLGFFALSVDTHATEDTSVPYNTYTNGPNNTFILTQTAYQPMGYLPLVNDLSQPEDMIIDDGLLYILNSGEKQIDIYQLSDYAYVGSVTHDLLMNPMGIDVYQNEIYIADKGLQAVLRLSADGDLIQRYDRPTEPIFGSGSPYVPVKIVVGPRGNMYIAGEGSTSGIIQLTNQGEFLGFFGTNITSQSWFAAIADFLNVQYALNVPTSATNLKMDLEGSLYTISPTDSKPLKRFNIASEDTLNVNYYTDNLNAVSVSNNGNILTLSTDGMITEYDPFGRLIFAFGGIDSSGAQRQGLMVLPSDIEIDLEQNIYVLDKGLNQVIMYTPTAFTKSIHEGLASFNDGIYDIDLWMRVLSYNEMFALANQAIGQASYRENRFDDALHYFELAQYAEGYSNTFWQIRYQFLQNYLGTIFLIFISLIIVLKILKKIDKKTAIYDPLRKFKAWIFSSELMASLRYLFVMMKHPIDTYYDLKHRHKSSYLAASIIYVIFMIMTIVQAIMPSFLFRSTSVENFYVLQHLFVVGGLLIAIVFSNYLIATLNDGEGWFKDVYIGFAYSLAPYIFFVVPLTVMSYGFTLFESFIYHFLWFVSYLWTGIYILLMLKETHGYSIRQLIKNIILTVITVLLLILILFISYLLLSQVFDYVIGLIREVRARA